ncbi:extracellular solute-binding protein [Oxalobacteraceae bacterium]|nr:extracellular solute-binding protein [Oxalobacteraceae bacterium]
MKLTILAAAAVLASSTFAAQATPVTITVASFPDLDRAVKVALPMWEKLHPEIKVKLVSLQIEDHHNSMTTALAAGAHLPDVMAVDFGYIGIFAESKGLEDLFQPPYSAEQYRKQFVSYTYAQATNSRGNLAAMPADIGPGTLFYRKDLMDKAGIREADLTASWESYIEAGKKLKAATGASLLARAGDLKDIYIRANLKDGEGIYFGDKGKVLVDTPRFVRAFELAKAARVAGIDSKTVAWTSEWSEGFKRGKVASQMTGSWLSGHLAKWLAPDFKGQWRTTGLPAGALASYGGSFYAIPKKAANKEQAWEFIKFMSTNKEVQLNTLREISAFPALIAAHSDPTMDEPQPYFGGQKTRLLARDTAVRIPVIRVDKYDSMANEVINSELENVLEQNKDIKTALADAKKLIERRARR